MLALPKTTHSISLVIHNEHSTISCQKKIKPLMSKLFDITCISDRECQHSGQLDLTLSGFEITLYTHVFR